MTPDQLLTEWSEHCNQIPDEVFHSSPKLKKLQEALVAARFAERMAAGRPDRVRLLTSARPDFAILRGNTEYLFEIVEADRPERRRGDEYRKLAELKRLGVSPKPELVDPDAEAAQAVSVIIDRVRAKFKKRYSADTHLLIYVNTWEPASIADAVGTIAAAIEPFREGFASISLLWGEEVVRVWPNPARMKPHG
jgi:hypothetical protein